MMSSYKLTYFNVRGRGEPIRLILHAAKQKFEDVTVSMPVHGDEWTHLKPSLPLGQLPILEIDGEVYPQTHAIARHLARRFGLAGKNENEMFRVDIISDVCADIMRFMANIFYEEDVDKQAELKKKFKDEFLPMNFSYLENMMKKYRDDSDYLVGNDLTWADLMFYDYAETTFVYGGETALNDFPLLIANRKKTSEDRRIKDYLKKRPQNPY